VKIGKTLQSHGLWTSDEPSVLDTSVSFAPDNALRCSYRTAAVFNDIHDLQENVFTDGEKFVQLRRENLRGDLEVQ
jgi:hypothetical protein